MSSYKETLDEMLKLAGVPLNEQDDEAEVDTEVEVDKEKVKKYSSDDKESEKEEPEEEETDEELVDKWEASIDSTGKVNVEFHESSITVSYKDRESTSIEVPSSLRNEVDKVSKLFNKIISHIERVS